MVCVAKLKLLREPTRMIIFIMGPVYNITTSKVTDISSCPMLEQLIQDIR